MTFRRFGIGLGKHTRGQREDPVRTGEVKRMLVPCSMLGHPSSHPSMRPLPLCVFLPHFLPFLLFRPFSSFPFKLSFLCLCFPPFFSFSSRIFLIGAKNQRVPADGEHMYNGFVMATDRHFKFVIRSGRFFLLYLLRICVILRVSISSITFPLCSAGML